MCIFGGRHTFELQRWKNKNRFIFAELRNCLNFMNDKCDGLYLDDFILCDEAHSGVYVTRSIRKKR